MNWQLIAIFCLQVSGTWGLLGSGYRDGLTGAALGHNALPNVTQTAAVKPTLDHVALPVSLNLGGRAGGIQPALGTAAAYAVDVESGAVLYRGADAGTPRAIASTTKLMTALVILEHHGANDRVTIPSLPAYQSDAELVGIQPGENYSIFDLVELMLVASGNDAADSLAIADSGTVAVFAAKMNAEAAKWGIDGVHFNNASGLIDTGNNVSAEALARIALLALHSPTIRDIVSRSSVKAASSAGHVLTFKSTDSLLATGQFYGIKTGYTAAAGQCFVGLTKISGHEVITVILGSTDRFGETQALTSWISQNYQWY